jgi:hypothetical protein
MPFDWNKVGEDELVALEMFASHPLLKHTGRDGQRPELLSKVVDEA